MSQANITIRVGIRDPRRNLSDYVRQVQAGTSVQVTSRDKVVAELRPPPVEVRPRRIPGSMKGQIWMADDFDETPQDIIEAMEADI